MPRFPLALALVWVLSAWGLLAQSRDLASLRNLGKAFYENPTTYKEAVDQFRRVLSLQPASPTDRLNLGLALLRAGSAEEGIAELQKVQQRRPDLPHTWFNLAIQWKKQGETDKALQQIRRFVELAPADPSGHYNLGALLKQSGEIEPAIQAFRQTIVLDRRLFGPHFQLFNVLRQSGNQEEARKELEAFQRLRKERESDAIPEDLEWSYYSEIYDEIPAFPPVKPVTPTYSTRNLGVPVDRSSATLTSIPEGVLVASKSGIAIVSPTGQILLKIPSPAFAAAAGDGDNDGRTDLVVITPGAVELRAPASAPPKVIATGEFVSALWLDYDHDYDMDLLLLGAQSRLLRNEGDKGFNPQPFPFANEPAERAAILRIEPDSKSLDVAIQFAGPKTILYRDLLGATYQAQQAVSKLLSGPYDLMNRGIYEITAAGVSAADTDGDGRLNLLPYPAAALDVNSDGKLDLFTISDNGTLQLLTNTTPGASRWITVSLEGVKNLKRAIGAEVEIKAGALYQKRFYTGAPLTFSLRDYAQADVVRITWPNGLIQNEVRQAAGKAYKYVEAQRLSGSCPQIWTWNGHGFQYITDVLGVAPLGASSGDGEYFPVDHDEYIQIPRGALAEKDGIYEIRVTEELSEVAYLDQIQLIAVDHPAGPSLYINDKFKAPPFPEFKLFAASRKLRPIRRGNEFDFGPNPPKRALLVLTGWVNWSDGSEFLQAAQTRDNQLVFPSLQAQGAEGHWHTIVEDMGLPSGKPKTIVVELNDLPSGRLRVVTNLAVRWTDVFLTPDVAPPDAHLLTAPLLSADLRFRGFSQVTVDPKGLQPEIFDYDAVSPVSNWNPTPGMYTRYGDVLPLLTAADDRLVIMGSGDEAILRFSTRLAPVRSGYQRDFLLKVEGWAKDRDPNTAYSQSVEPLPFRGMTRYPYPKPEMHPGGDWVHEYNTRPALRLIRPLVSQR